MRYFFFVLILSIQCCFALAQTPVSRHFGSGELTCDLITEICQDEDGIIWIGTINGLNRYDGWTFDHIFTEEGDTTSLNSNYIYELFSDSQGRLWVGTNLGLQLFDRYNNTFSSVHYPDGRRVPTERMVELANGELWIVLGNIYRLNAETLTAEPVEEINKITSSAITRVFIDSTGKTWLSGNNRKVYLLSEEDVLTIETEATLSSFAESHGEIFAASSSAVYRWNAQDSCFDMLQNECNPYTQAKLLATHDGRVLLTTAGQGFKTVDMASMTVQFINYFYNKEVDLEHVTIDDWIEDSSGNIWLGSTYNGVVMISCCQPDFMSYGPRFIYTSEDEMVNAVYYDSDGVLWGGSESGILHKYTGDGSDINFVSLPGSIYTIYEQDSRNLLVGTKYRGMYSVNKETGASRLVSGTEGLYIKKILPCPDGNIAISLFSGGIAFYDNDTGTLGRNIRAGTVNTLLYDKDGYIWCGIYGGIRVYGYADRSSKSIQANVALDASTVYALYEDSDGIIWIGTSGGLFSYDKATEFYSHYTMDGLKNQVICGLAGDNDGNIWASTFDGIVRFNPRENKVDTYKAVRGLSDTKYVRGSYWQDPESGLIFYGGQRDITGFDPTSISINPIEDAPMLTRVQINDTPVYPGTQSGKKPIADVNFTAARKINLSYKDNDLRLFYSTLDYRGTENIRAEYLLDREKQTHLTPIGSNMISLNNLKPGRHTIEVVLNENGHVSPPTILSIIIRKPWYATWPAIIVYLVLACGLAVALRALYRALQEKKAHERITERKLDFFTLLSYELRSPLTLVTLPLQKLLGNSYDEETDKALRSMQRNTEKVISLLNQSLDVRKIDEDKSSMFYSQVNLSDFIADILNGVDHWATHKGIDLTITPAKTKIPVWVEQNSFSRVISNLLDNAIKATPKGGSIKIETHKKDKYAEVVIQDTGKPFSEEQMEHMFELPYRNESGAILGTDIGLYLDHIIIEHLKGTLTATNLSNGQGRQFLVRIPLGNAHIRKHRMTDGTASTNSKLEQSIYYGDISPDEYKKKTARGSRKYSVVAIDESEDICTHIHDALSSRFKVTTFTSAIEGYNFSLTSAPDLIITDLMMPDLDGMALLKRIKESTNLSHIPVLLLTSIIEKDIQLKGLLTGADAIISKPFNEEELVIVSTNLIMSRSRLASRLKGIQVTEEMLQPVEISSNNGILMQKVINAINDNISNPDLNIDMLTAAVGISRAHLHRKIKEITGLSPGEYIRSIRLNQAAELLKGEKKNISQIAYSLGYSNPSVFSNTFKKFFGMTAKEYQDKHAGSTEAKTTDLK